MTAPTPWLEELPDEERGTRIRHLQDHAYIIRLTFGRSRIVVDSGPCTYEFEFW